jgi:hypothetical protein
MVLVCDLCTNTLLQICVDLWVLIQDLLQGEHELLLQVVRYV